MSKLDFGELLDHPEAVLFRSATTGRFVPVEDMAQGARGFVDQFFGDRVSVFYTEIESQQRPRLMVHQIVRHRDLALRAHQISTSGAGASPEANWLRAERELLAFSV